MTVITFVSVKILSPSNEPKTTPVRRTDPMTGDSGRLIFCDFGKLTSAGHLGLAGGDMPSL